MFRFTIYTFSSRFYFYIFNMFLSVFIHVERAMQSELQGTLCIPACGAAGHDFDGELLETRRDWDSTDWVSESWFRWSIV